MRKIKFFMLVAVVMLFTACHDKLWDSIEDLDSRVTKLEELCKEMNTNISALQTIVSVLQENDYISGIMPIEKGGEVIGYTIMFGKHDPITIYNGEDGKDGANGSGSTPIIGVAKDTDGIYYWTLNGEWLLDADGNKIRVTGEDGKNGADGKDGVDGTNGKDGVDGEDGKDGQDGQNGTNGTNGKDGVTPKLKIEDGYWYVSYDNGVTWIEVGKATGENGEKGDKGDKGDQGEKGDKGDKGDVGNDGQNGDSMFTSVTFDDENVYFTLANGTVLIVPRGNGTSNFDQTVIDNLVNSLTLNRDTIYLKNIGAKDTIIAITEPFPNSKVIWTSSDTTIVKVTDGIVEAIGHGEVLIVAQAGALKQECIVFADIYGVEAEYYYVDLGLSVKWATHDLGANSPDEDGSLFAWGEVEPKKSNFDWASYKYSDGGWTGMTKYCTHRAYGWVLDNKNILDLEDDAAYVNWGGGWRMPKYSELEELINDCNWELMTQNNVEGYRVIGPNGNFIFFKLGSARWSNRLGIYNEPYKAFTLSISSKTMYAMNRCNGAMIRAVCE